VDNCSLTLFFATQVTLPVIPLTRLSRFALSFPATCSWVELSAKDFRPFVVILGTIQFLLMLAT
jgi:hypothetical protein